MKKLTCVLPPFDMVYSESSSVAGSGGFTLLFHENQGVVYTPLATTQAFKIDGAMMSQLREIQFSGKFNECPIDHLRNFLDIVNSYQIANVHQDQMRLNLFPHTLAGKAKTWWWSEIPEGTVHTWDQLKVKFMNKFYTSARTHKYTQAISNFKQEDDESLSTAYERFKELLRKCPHHGMSEAALVRFFYQGLSPVYGNSFDLIGGGNFLDRTP